MKSTSFAVSSLALSLLFAGISAHAATIGGTVTDKTTGKPAAGDVVVLVNPMTGMTEEARATTDARGRYSLENPGSGPALLRVVHQGAEYFIAAPQGNAPGDLSVYDVVAKAQGVYIEADVLEAEADSGQLKITERYFVHNTSSPPVTQWSAHSFSIVLPADAQMDGVGAQRPNGLPTTVKMNPDGPKGHFSFNFPIQPDDGEKDTLFELSYHLPYSSGKYTFKSLLSLPADNLAVLLPKSMTFTPGAGASFNSVPEDPNVQTFLAKNVKPGNSIEFTIAGNGSIPREQQSASAGQMPGGADGNSPANDASTGNGGQPGGGIGTPINTPDPLSKYKWWILGGLALLLAAAAAFLLRKPPAGAVAAEAAFAPVLPPAGAPASSAAYTPVSSHAGSNAALLNALKEELFALESEKISGTIAPEEYAQVKAALEIVLKRALNRK
jgi:hypothetical protein